MWIDYLFSRPINHPSVILGQTERTSTCHRRRNACRMIYIRLVVIKVNPPLFEAPSPSSPFFFHGNSKSCRERRGSSTRVQRGLKVREAWHALSRLYLSATHDLGSSSARFLGTLRQRDTRTLLMRGRCARDAIGQSASGTFNLLLIAWRDGTHSCRAFSRRNVWILGFTVLCVVRVSFTWLSFAIESVTLSDLYRCSTLAFNVC